MDYEAEQASELEALESIYCDDMEMIDASPPKFRILIKSDGRDATDEAPSCWLVFTLTPRYPDEPPRMEVEGAESFHNVDTHQLVEHLEEQGCAHVGTVMVFTLVTQATEWLEERREEQQRRRDEAESARRRLVEEAERKRFEGTRVTVETFLAWRNQFEQETGVAARRERNARDSKKLTGRELFLRDTTLNQSDLKFLDDGDAVKVDESLFQELEDLDLDDDDDDEDYVPGADED